MANFLRMLVGVALLPACWGVARAFFDAVLAAGDAEGVSPEALSLLGGIAAFALCWLALSHPVRAYVLGHELTHAMWGVAFGARPSKLRVSGSGGSVNLTKTKRSSSSRRRSPRSRSCVRSRSSPCGCS